MKFLTFCVGLSFTVCIIFAVVILCFNYYGIEVSDTLIQMFYTVFGLEFGATAAITIAKYFIKRKEKTDYISDLKNNNLEIEKTDLKVQDDEDNDIYDFVE